MLSVVIFVHLGDLIELVSTCVHDAKFDLVDKLVNTKEKWVLDIGLLVVFLSELSFVNTLGSLRAILVLESLSLSLTINSASCCSFFICLFLKFHDLYLEVACIKHGCLVGMDSFENLEHVTKSQDAYSLTKMSLEHNLGLDNLFTEWGNSLSLWS